MADSYWVDPTISQIRSISINGIDVTSYTNAIRIFETVCKPYITGQITLVDTNNLIENMKLQGGETVRGAFAAPPNDSPPYEFDTRILTIKGHPAPNSLKKAIYTIDIIGPLYFQDRGSLVQSAHKGQIGTSAIQQIFGQYLGGDSLKVLQESIGMLGDKQGFTVNNKKPLTAISDIAKQSLFPGQSGNILMFRDRYNVNLAPLEYLMNNLSEQEHFIQKEVWGFEMDPLDIYRAIIFAAADNSRAGGRGGMGEVAAVANQSQVTFDMHTSDLKITDAAPISGGLISNALNSVSGFLGLSPGGLGGSPNVQVHNTQLQPAATAAFNKTMKEKMYSAQARGGPQLQWKVPLQTGINVTVGRGARVLLAPPTDLPVDLNSIGTNGLYFVTDLAHELVVTELGDVVGTTTFQGLLGGYGK